MVLFRKQQEEKAALQLQIAPYTANFNRAPNSTQRKGTSGRFHLKNLETLSLQSSHDLDESDQMTQIKSEYDYEETDGSKRAESRLIEEMMRKYVQDNFSDDADKSCEDLIHDLGKKRQSIQTNVKSMLQKTSQASELDEDHRHSYFESYDGAKERLQLRFDEPDGAKSSFYEAYHATRATAEVNHSKSFEGTAALTATSVFDEEPKHIFK